MRAESGACNSGGVPRNRDKHEESDEPELVRTGRVAKRLGVDVRTIQHAVEDGDLVPAVVTIGGHARFVLEDAELQWRERAKRKQQERRRSKTRDRSKT